MWKRVCLLFFWCGLVLFSEGCLFNPNIDAGKFVCTTDEDCPDEWVCYASLRRCYKKDAENIPLPDAGGEPCVVNGQERSCYTGPAGTARIGTCKQGLQVCKEGRWSLCEGQRTPAEDVCDGQDNDCNGIIDDGCPCDDGQTRACFSGSPALPGKGVCKRGRQTCVGKQWGACEGEVLPTTEICDNADNDCNGKIDDGLPPKRCYTGPPSSLGRGRCVAGKAFCRGGRYQDCLGEVRPAKEICDNQIDDDCDGTVDEGCGCNPGDVQVCYSGSDATRGKGECRAGTQRCGSDGKWGNCANEILPAKETCDGKDNDCDGQTDEELTTRPCYNGSPGTSGTGPCKDGLQACTNGVWGRCVGEVVPQPERCDRSDNDCDGTVDEGCQCIAGQQRPCYSGPPGTAARGTCKRGTQLCQANGTWSTCAGEVLPTKETCDGKDNDCDGTVDSYSRSCFDGPAASANRGICRPGAQTCAGGQWSRCLGQILPSKERCDGIDNDCDGSVDGLRRPCYNASKGCQPDPSGSYTCKGTCAAGQQICAAGAWSPCKGATEPARERCDNRDNDCDGEIDGYQEPCYTGSDQGCLPDGKGGFFCKGLCKAGTRTCQAGKLTACAGQITGTRESCDGKDNDCDGFVDEGCSCLNGQRRACYTGSSGTRGVGACKGGTQTCNAGQWGACVGQVVPTPESCNNRDDDCDGAVDENLQRSCYTGPAGTQNRGNCKSGSQRCSAGKWGNCAGEVLPNSEVCDGKDNDCNGKTDDNLTAPRCSLQRGVCSGARKRCGGAQGWLKCAAKEYGTTYELSETTCDGKDNDCDGIVDGKKACGFCLQSKNAATFSATPPGACKATEPCFDRCLWYKGQTYYCRNTEGKGFRYVSYNRWVQSCAPKKACTTSLCSATAYFCDGNSWRQGKAPGSNDDFCDGLDNNCDGRIDENCTCRSLCTADQYCKGACKRCVKSAGSLFPRCEP